MKYLSEVLNASHHKKEFSCGIELLDNYFRRQAKQDVKRKLSACFVLHDPENNKVAGFYTLLSGSISNNLIPISFKKKLPKSYTSIPTILIGRFAIDRNYQEKGMGKLLLIDSLKRCFITSETLGAYAVVVDPINPDSEKFYAKYGFITLPDSGKMFLPKTTIKTLFS